MKTETKHTPGPWEATEMGVIAQVCTSHGNFYTCALIDPDNNEDKANAMLIAAAPEMLQALKHALDFIHSLPYEHSNCPSTKLQDELFDTIAKAEGN